MKRIALYKYLLGGLLMVFAAACSGSDDDNTLPSPIEDMPKTVRLTITQTGDENGSANARLLDGTRATLSVNDQNDKVLNASWTANDALTYCNLSYSPYNQGSLTATESAATSSFSGNVLCKKDDKLAVVYPAKSFTVANYILQPYSITLSGQDGTLGTLATRFHYVYGVATVGPVVGTTATATMPKMKSLLTVCKFSFKDNNNDITVKELKISFSNDVAYPTVECHENTYPHSATVRLLDNDNNAIAQENVHATPVAPDADNTPLIVTLKSASKDVYVALLPTPEATEKISFKFEVTDESDQTYSGTAKAHLHEGKYVVATGLKLTKTN